VHVWPNTNLSLRIQRKRVLQPRHHLYANAYPLNLDTCSFRLPPLQAYSQQSVLICAKREHPSEGRDCKCRIGTDRNIVQGLVGIKWKINREG